MLSWRFLEEEKEAKIQVRRKQVRRLFQFKDGDREAVESFISSLGIDTAQKDFQDVLNGVFGEEKIEDILALGKEM